MSKLTFELPTKIPIKENRSIILLIPENRPGLLKDTMIRVVRVAYSKINVNGDNTSNEKLEI